MEEHADYLKKLWQESIEELNLKITDQLLNTFVLIFSFVDYGRFIEINFHKSTKLRRAKPRKKKDGTYTDPDKKRLRKKDTRFYAHNAYGSINRLAGRMLYGLTEEEIKRIKEILEG